MEASGIIGMSFVTIGMGVVKMGFIYAMSALAKVSKLEKQLKETGVLDKEYESG